MERFVRPRGLKLTVAQSLLYLVRKSANFNENSSRLAMFVTFLVTADEDDAAEFVDGGGRF